MVINMVYEEGFDKKTNRAIVTINVIGCLLILLIPLLITFELDLSIKIFIRIIAGVIPILLVFYLNFFWLIKRFLVKQQWARFLFSNLAVSLSMSIISILLYRFFPETFGFDDGMPVILFFFRDIFFVSITTGLAMAIRMTIEWYKTEKAKAKIEAVASQAELKNLKNQLNPHFLFNTLNNIYSLISLDTEKAQNSVLGLSKILRYVMYDNNQDMVPIEKELAFTRSYIELMSLRLTDKVEMRLKLPERTNEQFIAPLMFISLVENAFKHGVSQTEPSFIDIEIELANNSIICTVKNSFFPKKENDYSGSGIGITNLKRRLELLYPKKHDYDISLLDNVYTAKLKIQLD